jgi:signal transduction histidine kinase
MNIIQNAIDAMYNRPQKVLTVTTKYEEPNIILTISDTGCGIPDQNYENLFDPFFTTKRSPQESNQNEPTGTGLGLSTVHSLLLPYAVEIGIESVVEQGTTFKLTIPASKLQPPVEN